MNHPSLPFAAGDVIVQRGEDGLWSPAKILCVDTWPDDSSTVHCRFYERTPRRPEVADIAALRVQIGHAPIAAAALAKGWHPVAQEPVVEADLDGFFDYLRHTDFPRYLQVTRQDAAALVQQANAHYQRGGALNDTGRRVEAIAAYDAAIDAFPLFFEAIDNRAFTLMELRDFRAALQGFEHSLRMNPDGFAAFFSTGECQLRLRDLPAAEAVFSAGLERFPAQRETFAKYLEMTRALRK